MPKNTQPPRNRDYDHLMNKVCVGSGYCGSVQDGKSVHVDDFIPDSGVVTADQFVDWLLLAESFDPNEVDEVTKRRLRAVFVECMGATAVDATRLKWLEEPRPDHDNPPG